MFLALALLNRPRLVILDELTQGLDPAARRNVWAAVRQLHEEGTTVLLVTHEMDEAEELCGRIIAMRDGRVLGSGTPAELIDRHARRATVRFTLPEAGVTRLEQLRRIDGVQDLALSGTRVTLTGDRGMIAYVGAVAFVSIGVLLGLGTATSSLIAVVALAVVATAVAARRTAL